MVVYKITIKYILFAVLATMINIGSQYLSFNLLSSTIENINIFTFKIDLYIAMIIGTFLGLLTKYILDKKYIFFYETKNNNENIKLFILYSTMGILTTGIFWVSELCFNYFFIAEYAKYIGAIIGLTIGYVSKYFLDKKYVFNIK